VVVVSINLMVAGACFYLEEGVWVNFSRQIEWNLIGQIF